MVLDENENRITNADVKFKVAVGDVTFENGGTTITVKTDKNGFAAVRPLVGATAGIAIIKATPAENSDNFFEATFTLQALAAKEGPTQFSGTLINDKGQPLPGARMSIGRTALTATVDDNGHFTFDDVPPGKIDLFVDGRTINVQGEQYPALHFESTAIKGVKNQLPHPIYLPQLAMAEGKIVGGDKDVILKMPGFEGYEMTVFANSVTFPDGSKTGPLVVSPINFDKLPMTPPGGYAGFMAPAAGLQPAGTRFDPPLQLKIPNTAGFKPGEKRPVYQWDHDLAAFVQMGQATVTEDAAFLITDPGTGISKAGWHPIPNPPPPDDCPSSGTEPDCDDCSEKLDTTNGQCPKLYCKPSMNDGAECDDGKYCTDPDTCKGGTCTGKPIPDKNSLPVVTETNLAVFNTVFRVLNAVGVGVKEAFAKVTLTSTAKEICCESKEGEFAKGGESRIDARISIAVGPIQLAGPKFPFPAIGSLEFGLFVTGEFGFQGFMTGTYAECEGYDGCWGGGGNVFMEVIFEGGVVVKNGPLVVAKATIGAKTGLSVGVVAACTEAGTAGTYWNGVTLFAVVEVGDGVLHLETNYQWKEPVQLDPFSFSLPKVKPS